MFKYINKFYSRQISANEPLHIKYDLAAVFLFAVGMRLLYNFFWGELIPHDDGVGYDGYAMSLVTTKTFWFEGSYSSRAPGYPFFLALIYKIFGHNYLPVKIAQAVLGGGICLVVYSIVYQIIRQRIWALISAGFCIIDYALLEMNSVFLSETLFTFLSLIFIWCIVSVRSAGWIRLALGGIVLGLANLTRPILLLMPGYLLFWLWREYPADFAVVLKKFSAIVIPFVLVLLPWTIRNYRINGIIAPVNIQSGYQFWNANNEYKIYPSTAVIEGIFGSRSIGLSEYQKDKMFFKEGLKFFRGLTVSRHIGLFIKKQYYVWCPTLGSYDVTFVLILPFCIYGMIRSFGANYIFYYLFLNFFIVTAVFAGIQRYRTPLEPFTVIFGIIGLKMLFDKYSENKKFILICSMWVLLNAVVFYLETIMNFNFGFRKYFSFPA